MRDFNVDISQSAFDLSSDGSFESGDLPDCSKEMACSGKLQDISGTWSLAQHQDWWAVRLLTSRIDGASADFGVGAILRLDEPPYLIHFTIGDPDSGQTLAFELDRSNVPR